MNTLLRFFLYGVIVALLMRFYAGNSSVQDDHKASPAPVPRQTPEVALSDTPHTQQAKKPNESEHIHREGPNGHDFDYIESALRRDPRRITFAAGPDGSTYADLGGSFLAGTMARRLPDGSLQVACFTNFGDAQDFLLSSPPPPTIDFFQHAEPPAAER